MRKREGTHLDKSVGGITIGNISDREALTVGDLLDCHGEEGNGVLLGTLVFGIESADVCVDGDWIGRGGEEVVKVAERDTEGKDIP